MHDLQFTSYLYIRVNAHREAIQIATASIFDSISTTLGETGTDCDYHSGMAATFPPQYQFSKVIVRESAFWY